MRQKADEHCVSKCNSMYMEQQYSAVSCNFLLKLQAIMRKLCRKASRY